MSVGGKENEIQAAITGALEVYCQNRQLQLFPPYANQQGIELRKYCGDLIGLLDDAEIILLEIKELSCDIGVLPAFDATQHSEYMQLEELNVPIAYAYNSVAQLAYHDRPRPNDWARQTLEQVNRAVPSTLPNHQPHTTAHENLLNWLQNAKGRVTTNLLGRIHGAVTKASDLRNGALVLIYGVSDNALATLKPEDVLKIINYLQRHSHLHPKHAAQIQNILGGSADVFQRFVKPVGPNYSTPSNSSTNPKQGRPKKP
jgi:hypothetical protein